VKSTATEENLDGAARRMGMDRENWRVLTMRKRLHETTIYCTERREASGSTVIMQRQKSEYPRGRNGTERRDNHSCCNARGSALPSLPSSSGSRINFIQYSAE
jgi:hypothetical protein